MSRQQPQRGRDHQHVSPPLSAYVRFFFSTLPHPDLLYYRWSFITLLTAYFLCAAVIVPKLLQFGGTEAEEAWWALRWGSLSVAVLVSLIIALRFIDPGSVRPHEQQGQHPQQQAEDSSKQQSVSTLSQRSAATVPTSSSPDSSVCSHCGTVHARRCHHCRRCRLCVVRYDHHCVLIDLCIGQSNYRFFMAAIALTSVSCAIAARLCLRLTLALSSSLSPAFHPRTLLAGVTCLTFAVVAVLCVVYLFIHMLLLLSSRTLHEAYRHNRSKRKRARWCSSSVPRDAVGLLFAGGLRLLELEGREMVDERSWEARMEAEGWDRDEDVEDEQRDES